MREALSMADIVICIIGLILIGYLIAVIVRPERF
ncbi:MAG: potassium-transporting ATPase subunit F [Candidatus Krumholzibacteriaceae bacterium]|jgi:K+-transporting ATPase KdpF subunit